MSVTADKIINDLKKGAFHPVYWLQGEEFFFIDKVTDYAEHHLLPESEADFNLTIFYGRDSSWQDVINACRRYPMFAERQVVLLKEAQAMKDLEKLESYLEKPLSSTILFVAYKDKKVDGRTKLARVIKEKCVSLTTQKIYDNKLPDWTNQLVNSKGLTIHPKALLLLIDHLGNDLGRINNEIDKLALNLGKRIQITEDDIEQYIGVSKEFNVFELQSAIGQKDLYKAMRIIQYFAANPKAGSIQMVLPSLYAFFSKVHIIFGISSQDENSIQKALGLSSGYFVRDYVQAARHFGPGEVEKLLLLLHHYNLRSVGIDDAGTDGAELMKEMVAKMIAA